MRYIVSIVNKIKSKLFQIEREERNSWNEYEQPKHFALLRRFFTIVYVIMIRCKCLCFKFYHLFSRKYSEIISSDSYWIFFGNASMIYVTYCPVCNQLSFMAMVPIVVGAEKKPSGTINILFQLFSLYLWIFVNQIICNIFNGCMSFFLFRLTNFEFFSFPYSCFFF